ncbi:polysaccharide deacetylase family protein [Fervidicola ferrireducens]|uniref:polysaccharide deacetylase family protein n=1 Tax=Fervidicola ferrireducens TaxID=520764 RepID=UPI0012EDDA0F|nr:polysaccharide deacetylase family protein [Fervidicola ferrireducens]
MDDKYPDMTKLIAKEGHKIGNHSATPLRMSSLSKQQEMKSTHEKIKELPGQE